MLTLLSLLCAHASAAELSLQLQGGRLNTDSAGQQVFSDRQTLHHGGLRAGYALGEHLEAVGSFSASTASRTLLPGEQRRVDVRMNTFTYGAGVRYHVGETVRPYGLAQLWLMQGGLRLDAAPDEDENLDAFVNRGFAPGGYGALGIELRPQPDWTLSPIFFAEGGYHWVAPLELGVAGEMVFRGFGARAGLGVVF